MGKYLKKEDGVENQKQGDISFIAGNWPLDIARPTIIFLHGAALSKNLWAAQVAALANIANTIAIDLPGHKDSGGDACDRISDYALSVSRFVEDLKMKSPILCGMSMGGAIAQELMITRPDMFRSAMLMHTGARLKVLPFIFETIKKDYASYLDLVVTFSISKKSDHSKIKALMDDIAVLSQEVAVKDFTACDQFDVMAQLGQIRARVLVVTGNDDAVTPPKYGEFLQKNIPDAKMIRIADTGHLSPIEQPEQVSQLIREFVSQMLPSSKAASRGISPPREEN
jgi:pimeloyl-ACP methyl ester carboxylesterase